MTDIDDILTLPLDGDDGPAERVPSAEGAPGRTEPVSSIELIALSSSEARLATALLMQAQVLEGMRREQADLLRRIEAGPSRAALKRSLGQVEAALKQVARLQQKARGQIARSRRRSTLLNSALLILTLGLGGFVGWLAWTTQRELPESLASLEQRLSAAEDARLQDIDRAVTEVVTRVVAGAMSGHGEALAELSTRLDGEQQGLRGEITELRAENRSSLNSLDEERTKSFDLRRQIGALEAGRGELDQQLDDVREQRNRQIGENARLVGQVLEGERRLQELAETVAGLQLTQAARRAEPVATAILTSPPASPDGLSARVTGALRASGVRDLVMLEIADITDGALHDAMLRQVDPASGVARVLHVGRGWIVVDGGRARLRLDPVREQGAQQASVIEIPLPALEPAVWRDIGLTVPDGFTPLPRVTTALDLMLAGQGWRVSALGSFDGGILGELELVQQDANGIVRRTLKAASGFVLPTGPKLELRDGTVRIGGDERPFFRGVFLLPLPGADYGAWLTSTDGSAQ